MCIRDSNYSFDASDNCGAPSILFSIPDGSFLECDSIYTVEMLVEDLQGNIVVCDFNVELIDCSDCCKSQTVFDDLVELGQDYQSVIDGNVCLVTSINNRLDTCQYIESVDWDDGTISEFMISGDSFLDHQYTLAGVYDVCINYGEYNDNGLCWSSQKCESIIISDNCSIRKSNASDSESVSLMIAPNPFTDKISFIINSDLQLVRSEVYSVQSSLVHLNDSGDTVINTSDWPSGIYIVRSFLDNGLIVSHKVVKL